MIVVTYPKTEIIDIVKYNIFNSTKLLIIEYKLLNYNIFKEPHNIRRLYVLNEYEYIIDIFRIQNSLVNIQYGHSSLGVYYESMLTITNENRMNLLKLEIL